MKHAELWEPSKFVYKKGKLTGSRNKSVVGISSRLVVDIVATHYDLYLKDHVKGNLIDLGCGRVPLYEAYKNYASNCTCADWENSNHKNPHLDYICDLNQPLPFKNEEFDTIILSDVLEHIKYPEKLWAEMTRILTSGGKIILNVPFFYKLHEIPHDYFRYTQYALENFATHSALRIVLLKPIGGVPEILTDLISKNIMRFPAIGKYIAMFIQQICSIFVKTSVGRKISQKTGIQFPLGYFMIVEKSRNN
jgi:SAM-dependent methyltransferase